jgi:phosphate transport system permease protein
MNVPLRQWLNRLFTGLAILSVVLIVAALVGILLPMIWRGGGAIVFRGTAEFRRLQLQDFHHGDAAKVHAETEATLPLRREAWQRFDRFAMAVDPSELETWASQAQRELQTRLEKSDVPDDEAPAIRRASRKTRDKFIQAIGSEDKAQALAMLDEVRTLAKDERLKGTSMAGVLDLADQYAASLALATDLHALRSKYLDAVKEVRLSLQGLLGPRPDGRVPAVKMEQYGATRWDQATKSLDSLMWAEQWVSGGQCQSLCKVRTPRKEQFAGTELAGFFPFVEDHTKAMLRPHWTFYWQYFIDDSTPGHYFGGVGPEIIGTLLVTVLAILVALPIGVIAAAYLVECAGDTFVTRSLRTCINTLAGVPSVVFGLFGLAFFVVWFLPGGQIIKIGNFTLNWPGLGMNSTPSVIAGALTLALLVLPVMIRASEEAIRTVPQAYKEASLSLGASGFRCFVTVTLPSALPGILTGLILSMSRAAGETAALLFACGVAMGPVPHSLTEQTRTLAYSSYDMAVGDKTASLAPHNQFGMVMTLVVLVLILNLTAIIVRGKLSRKLRGQ